MQDVVSLYERAPAIGEIMANFGQIAEQSDLLALNASMEAVSAGDSGGRFSVVAHEMKNLADRARGRRVRSTSAARRPRAVRA